jgi:crossover junction endodeoxyribonuclease RuvC
MAVALKILGIDPGSRAAGYGVVYFSEGRFSFFCCGVIRANTRQSFPERLHEIHQGISEVIEKHQPDLAAIEEVFMAKNPGSALKLGHARGVLILAAMQKGLSLGEYSPRQIKQAVAGYGNADKAQIQHMVKAILSLAKSPSHDAADALAVAICHANHLQLSHKLG